MTAPVFGYVPNKRGLQLSTGADFILGMILQQGEWPEGTDIRIELSEQVWHATIVGPTAAWKVESEAADLVPADVTYRMYVRYPDDPDDLSPNAETTDLLWFYGKVKRTRT